mmetsp:Transcript_36125/g.55477  ORF Transcript_36125/g.55477 Transcript_36125/m.55477 type:complete len:95 (+) Transcript_36125:208-492(+)
MSKLNKAYLKLLDRKFDRLFKSAGRGRLTNTSKSVYSFEGEVLSEEDDEYNSDTSSEVTNLKDTKSKVDMFECRSEIGEEKSDDQGSQQGQPLN